MRIAIAFICLSATVLVQAQSLYNKSLISINANSILFVKDSLVNNGTIINNGDMQIGGAWINNDQYDAGNGQITFNSDLPQIINHNDQSFSKLTISGGGEKIFLANITIENELNLTEGILVSDNNSKIIFENTAQLIGGSDHAHIRGLVYHKGEGSKTFPLGNGTIYLPVTLTNIQGADAEIGVELVQLNGETLSTDHFLDNVSSQRYWKIDVVSGSVSNSLAVLPVRDENIITDETQAVVAQASVITEKFKSLGRSSYEGDFSNGSVTSKDFVSALFLAVGDINGNGAVSVYNAVSPNNDGLNDFMRIFNIESFPNNKVSLFNRWGDKVFEMVGYNNTDRVFTGKSNVGGNDDLPSGTYYYVIDRNNGAPLVNGYLALKK